MRNALYNIDGTGIAWYTSAQNDFFPGVDGMRSSLYKTTTPPLADMNFKSICINTSTTALFAHIRASSGSPVVTTNNHPFVFGRHTFMHNGSVSSFSNIRRAICDEIDLDCYANVFGGTDSEHIAALYTHYLTLGNGKDSWQLEYPVREMAAALHKAVAFVIKAQMDILGDKRRPNSLNLAATDGRRLLTYRFRNHKVEQPPSLYYSTTAGVTLNRKYEGHPNADVGGTFGVPETQTRMAEEHGKHVIVASEPTTYIEEEWELLPKNSCLMMDVDGKVVVEDVAYDESWDAEDVTAYETKEHQACTIL